MADELLDFANKVCRDLPEEYELALHLEKHSGGFILYRNGLNVDLEDYTSVDNSLIQQGEDALAYAIANAGAE